MHQRAGLHRADFMAAVPEIPRCPRNRQSHRGRAGGQEIHPHHRQGLPLGNWAAPKDKGGKLDHNNALTGDDLRDFVNHKLFPYLQGFKQAPAARTPSNTRSARSSARSKTRSRAATTCAKSSTTSTNCASAPRPRNTKCPTSTKPRSRTWAMPGATAASITPRARSSAPSSRSLKPQDRRNHLRRRGRFGGFLCEAFDYLKSSKKLTTKDLKTLQTKHLLRQGKEVPRLRHRRS